MDTATSNREPTLEDIEAAIARVLHGADGVVIKYTKEVAKGVGKRIRPRLLIIFSSIFGGGDFEKIISSAACVELLHTASLIHDDIVDEAVLRRGRQTLNSKFGNKIAVLVGDYLLGLTFSELTRHKDIKLVELMLNSAQELGTGAINEILNRDNLDMSEEEYFKMVSLKTSPLFKLACKFGAYLGGADETVLSLASEFGVLFGQAFQVVDDILDLCLDSSTAGKPTFNDLKEGRITLPIIHALRTNKNELVSLIHKYKKTPDRKIEEKIRNILYGQGSFRYAYTKADEKLNLAWQRLDTMMANVQSRSRLAELELLKENIVARIPRSIIS